MNISMNSQGTEGQIAGRRRPDERRVGRRTDHPVRSRRAGGRRPGRLLLRRRSSAGRRAESVRGAGSGATGVRGGERALPLGAVFAYVSPRLPTSALGEPKGSLIGSRRPKASSGGHHKPWIHRVAQAVTAGNPESASSAIALDDEAARDISSEVLRLVHAAFDPRGGRLPVPSRVVRSWSKSCAWPGATGWIFRKRISPSCSRLP